MEGLVEAMKMAVQEVGEKRGERAVNQELMRDEEVARRARAGVYRGLHRRREEKEQRSWSGQDESEHGEHRGRSWEGQAERAWRRLEADEEVAWRWRW